MGKEVGRNIGSRVMDSIRKRFRGAAPTSANVDGPVLTEEEQRRIRLRTSGRLFTKRASDEAANIPNDQRIPFGDVAEHRRRRGLR